MWFHTGHTLVELYIMGFVIGFLFIFGSILISLSLSLESKFTDLLMVPVQPKKCDLISHFNTFKIELNKYSIWIDCSEHSINWFSIISFYSWFLKEIKETSSNHVWSFLFDFFVLNKDNSIVFPIQM